MRLAMDCTGNASSVHGEGRAARKLLDDAREQVARAVGVIAPMVVFTSGGTEAANWLLQAWPGRKLVVSAVEHPCVLKGHQFPDEDLRAVQLFGCGRCYRP